jgi:hypothetical protein
MPEPEHTAARDCKKRLQEIILAARRKGFSRIAVAYPMLEALSNINRQIYSEYLPSARAEREAQDDTEKLLTALNKAHRATLH